LVARLRGKSRIPDSRPFARDPRRVHDSYTIAVVKLLHILRAYGPNTRNVIDFAFAEIRI
jgi:hypothetical protein